MATEPTTSPAERPHPPLRVMINISRWVNESSPPLMEILSAHDVARLTRRPRWLLIGLSLVGSFLRRVTLRGRRVGWHRSDVLAWMAGDLAIESADTPPRPCACRRPRQPCRRRSAE